MKKTIIAYIAGIIDGEAYVGIKKSTWGMRNRPDVHCPTYSERVQIRMNCREVLELIKSHFGGSLGTEPRIYQSVSGFKGRKIMSIYRATDRVAANLIAATRPYLIEKTRQADCVLALRHNKNLKQSHKRPLSQEILNKRQAWQDGGIGESEDVSEDVPEVEPRNSSISWISPNQENTLVFEKIIQTMNRLNAMYLYLDWDEYLTDIQLTRYVESQFYAWHLDVGHGETSTRKLSATIFLNKDFEGGEFQFFHNTLPTTIEAVVGRVVVFPSHVLHRVTPITKGVRYSLVAWGHGPRLK